MAGLSRRDGTWLLLCAIVTLHASLSLAVEEQTETVPSAATLASWGTRCKNELAALPFSVATLNIQVAKPSLPFWQRVKSILEAWGFVPKELRSFSCSGSAPSSWGLSVTFGRQPALAPGMIEEIEAIRSSSDKTTKAFTWDARTLTLTFMLNLQQARKGVASDRCTVDTRTSGTCMHKSRCRGQSRPKLCPGSADIQCCLPTSDLTDLLRGQRAIKQMMRDSLASQNERIAEQRRRAEMEDDDDDGEDEDSVLLSSGVEAKAKQKDKGKARLRRSTSAATQTEKETETVEATNPVERWRWRNHTVRWTFWEHPGQFRAYWWLDDIPEDIATMDTVAGIFEKPDADEQRMWMQAVEYWKERQSCIKFEQVPINAVGHKLLVVGHSSSAGFCSASPGTFPVYSYKHLSFSVIFLDVKACSNRSLSVIHEIGHVVGMAHTMNRADAGLFVRVHPENVPYPDNLTVANDLAADPSSPMIGAYEYGSAMDYPARYSFYGAPAVRLIEALRPNVTANEDRDNGGMGQHHTKDGWLTDNDVAIVHRHYNCPAHLSCPTGNSTCPTAATLNAARIKHHGDCRPGYTAIPANCRHYCMSYTDAPKDAQCYLPARRRPSPHPNTARRVTIPHLPWHWPPDISSHTADERFPYDWPCNINGAGGRCLTSSVCKEAGGRASSGFCGGSADIKCCHMGRNAAAVSGTKKPATCKRPKSGSCITEAECLAGKGALQKKCTGSSSSKYCCRFPTFPKECKEPDDVDCRAIWYKL